jgi:acyl carrier protein
MTTATEHALLRYIVDELLTSPPSSDDPLAAGELDSLAIEQLLTFIEEEYDVEFEEEELRVENFRSIQILAALVDAKREAAQADAVAPLDEIRQPGGS